MADDKAISKTLSYWLRHAPEAGDLELDQAGWTSLDGVVAAFAREGKNVSRQDIERVVAQSEKQRFELSADLEQIRARQGHSVTVDAGWEPRDPPELLYHGTVARFLDAILVEGLRPGDRHHVHLSGDEKTAQIVGKRRGEAIILTVAAKRLAAAGGQFLLSSNGVWLIDHVPAEFISTPD